jgi:hypothetical protein
VRDLDPLVELLSRSRLHHAAAHLAVLETT